MLPPFLFFLLVCLGFRRRFLRLIGSLLRRLLRLLLLFFRFLLLLCRLLRRLLYRCRCGVALILDALQLVYAHAGVDREDVV